MTINLFRFLLFASFILIVSQAGYCSDLDISQGSGVFESKVDNFFNQLPTGLRDDDNLAPKARVKLINRNSHGWYARWAVLESAKKSIDITYFIITRDAFGKSLLGLLQRKAMKGVKIRILVDARGTKDFVSKFKGGLDYMQELLQYPNVKAVTYNPVGPTLPNVLFDGVKAIISCTHDKIIIVDDKWVVTGGRNIGHHYFVDPEDDPVVFRDTDVVMCSNKVSRIARIAFDEEYSNNVSHQIGKDLFGNLSSKQEDLEICRRAMAHYISGKGFLPLDGISKPKVLAEMNEELKKYPSLNRYSAFVEEFYDYFNTPSDSKYIYPVKILDKHSMFGQRNDITPNLIRLIDNSEEEIIIQNPYIVISPEVWEAMKNASKRGVKIIIYTNSATSNNHLITQAAFHDDWKKMMKDMPTLKIFVRTDKRNIHSKVFVFDRRVSIIGTYNMDYLSQDMNSEIITLINSPVFSKECRDLLIKEISQHTMEYKIALTDSGEIIEVVGPQKTLPEEVKRELKKLGFFARFLRKLI